MSTSEARWWRRTSSAITSVEGCIFGFGIVECLWFKDWECSCGASSAERTDCNEWGKTYKAGWIDKESVAKVNAQVALEKKDTTLGIGVLTDNDWGDIIKSVLCQAKATGLIRAIIAKLATLESDWWLTFERKNTSLNRHGIRYVSSWGVMTVWTNFYHHLPIENQLRQWLELF